MLIKGLEKVATLIHFMVGPGVVSRGRWIVWGWKESVACSETVSGREAAYMSAVVMSWQTWDRLPPLEKYYSNITQYQDQILVYFLETGGLV